jgi:hypothetical protein
MTCLTRVLRAALVAATLTVLAVTQASASWATCTIEHC